MHSHRFEEIQAQTGGTPQMIATRLKSLEAEEIVERRKYSERPPRYEYHLTEKGNAFYPVILALRAWGETWIKAPDEGRAINYTHLTCGEPAGLGPVCESCGEPLKRGICMRMSILPMPRKGGTVGKCFGKQDRPLLTSRVQQPPVGLHIPRQQEIGIQSTATRRRSSSPARVAMVLPSRSENRRAWPFRPDPSACRLRP
ncbi:winged helix-turn-helix transcriptional regulator [Rhizobium jaguaris]|uniref:winged helix-turn-helix transcriptional regulator n=1 Tax=Rhizobium jaguaris TaxID=1312183 RepID=UPI003CCA98BD